MTRYEKQKQNIATKWTAEQRAELAAKGREKTRLRRERLRADPVAWEAHLAACRVRDVERHRRKMERLKSDPVAYRQARDKQNLKYRVTKSLKPKPVKITISLEEKRLKMTAYQKAYREKHAERRRLQKQAYYKTPRGIETRRTGSERLHRRMGIQPRQKLPPLVALERARASYRKYQQTHRHMSRATYARRYKTDLSFKLTKNLRKRVWDFLSGKTKAKKTKELLGCTLNELKIHLEKQFKPGMSWETYGRRGWHIDHIVPCSLFDMTDPEQQAKCFHFSNLAPLEGIANIIKGNKLPPGIPHPNPPCIPPPLAVTVRQ